MSDSLRPHESQHARPPCPSPTPWIHSNSCPSSRWCHLAVSSSVVPFSCPQFLPASGSFPMSQLFAWGGQSKFLQYVIILLTLFSLHCTCVLFYHIDFWRGWAFCPEEYLTFWTCLVVFFGIWLVVLLAPLPPDRTKGWIRLCLFSYFWQEYCVGEVMSWVWYHVRIDIMTWWG